MHSTVLAGSGKFAPWAAPSAVSGKVLETDSSTSYDDASGIAVQLKRQGAWRSTPLSSRVASKPGTAVVGSVFGSAALRSVIGEPSQPLCSCATDDHALVVAPLSVRTCQTQSPTGNVTGS